MQSTVQRKIYLFISLKKQNKVSNLVDFTEQDHYSCNIRVYFCEQNNIVSVLQVYNIEKLFCACTFIHSVFIVKSLKFHKA